MRYFVLASMLLLVTVRLSDVRLSLADIDDSAIDLSGGPCGECSKGELPLDPGRCRAGQTESIAGCVTNPRRIKLVNPKYPSHLRRAGQEGCAALRLVVGDDGRVEDISVEHATDPLFGKAATKAVKQWRYEPAVLGEDPVAVKFCVLVAYKMR